MRRLVILCFALFALGTLAQTCPVNVSVATSPVYKITVAPLTPNAVTPITVTVSSAQNVAVTVNPNILAPEVDPRLPAPGASGHVCTSDGSKWISAAPAPGGITGPTDSTLVQTGTTLAINLANPNSWNGLQIWNAGGYIGGQASSDVAPEYTVIGGKSAFPGATVNTTGGPLVLSGGAGVSSFTVTDWTKLYGGQVQITLNDRLPNKIIYVLTEGVEFAASTSNAVTAQNLAAAINAWCPGVYATAFGAVVGLEKAPAMTNMAALLPAGAPGLSIANAGYGQTYLDGPVTATYTISLQGDTICPTGQTQAIDASNLNIDASLATAIQLSGASAVTVANVVGTPAAVAGKTLFLLFSDSNVTIPNNSPFALAAPYTGVAGGVLALRFDGSVWRELFRYPNFLSTPPALSTSTGTPGQYSYDSNYFYICVAANTWRRVAVASW
jgi:hypothetical protein